MKNLKAYSILAAAILLMIGFNACSNSSSPTMVGSNSSSSVPNLMIPSVPTASSIIDATIDSPMILVTPTSDVVVVAGIFGNFGGPGHGDNGHHSGTFTPTPPSGTVSHGGGDNDGDGHGSHTFTAPPPPPPHGNDSGEHHSGTFTPTPHSGTFSNGGHQNIFAQMNLTPGEVTQINGFNQTYMDCLQGWLTQLRQSEQAIYNTFKAQYQAVQAQLKAGTIDRKTAQAQIQTINAALKAALQANPVLATATAGMKACHDAWAASVRAILTPAQQTLWDAWIAQNGTATLPH
jgi:Spy/CpxP family protein refolding chaperone